MSGQFITLQSEKLVQARKNYKASHDQFIKTKKKLLDVCHELKRNAAAIEELHSNPDCTAYTQAGRAFIAVSSGKLAFTLEEKMKKTTDTQTQLAELENRMAERVKTNKMLMNQIQEEALREYQESLTTESKPQQC